MTGFQVGYMIPIRVVSVDKYLGSDKVNISWEYSVPNRNRSSLSYPNQKESSALAMASMCRFPRLSQGFQKLSKTVSINWSIFELLLPACHIPRLPAWWSSPFSWTLNFAQPAWGERTMDGSRGELLQQLEEVLRNEYKRNPIDC